MAVDMRKKDVSWRVADERSGGVLSTDHAQLAVLMDIRDEQKAINARLGCYNTLSIPDSLRRIAKNTTKPRRRRRRVRA